MAILSQEQLRSVNVRYHDGAAASYDAKWGIDFGAVGRAQVLGKMTKALGRRPVRFERSLEIGAGTGYFTLNLVAAGALGRATCTDVSPGMVAALERNADRLGLEVETAVCCAQELPFADGSFDLVLGHAVLHHIPDLERAFAEMRRVLSPGGWICFAGEPSRIGDRLALVPKRAAMLVAPAWRRLVGAAPAVPGAADGGADNHALEHLVDARTFTPAELRALARRAGLERERVRGEELLANWFGWLNRTLEASADARTVPHRFRLFAFRGYLALQAVDRRLERIAPARVGYNLLLSARAPSDPPHLLPVAGDAHGGSKA